MKYVDPHRRSIALGLYLCAAIAACADDPVNPGEGDSAIGSEVADAAVDVTAQAEVDVDAAIDGTQEGVGDGVATELPDGDATTSDDGGEPLCDVPATADPAVVAVETGLVRGVQDGGARVFYGIPFAAPPVGDRRFLPPEPASCWTGELALTDFAPACIQRDPTDGTVSGQEDCLTLNVWAPTEPPTTPRPVMVYIHGGGNVIGSASTRLLNLTPLFDGRRLAERHDVIVVTLQYRLGPMGFLNLPELADTNLATRDQIAALQWVQRNIAAFGGDPDTVMLFGESAGAVNTCALLASPLAAGLFHRALMQSGSCVASSGADVSDAMSQRVDTTDCGSDTAADRVACLRALSPEALVEMLPGSVNALSAGIAVPDLAAGYGPVVDGEVLLQSPLEAMAAGNHNPMPVVVGANNDELALTLGVEVPSAAAFEQLVNATFAFLPTAKRDQILAIYDPADYPSPTAALVALYSDLRFICPARKVARTLAESSTGPGNTVWRYHFQRQMEGKQGPLPASHGIELPFVFGTLSDLPKPVFDPVPDDVALSDAMIAMWAAFAATGNPQPADGPGADATWPPATAAQTDAVVILDAPLSASSNGVRTAECDLWDGILD